ncbi:MAG: domain containing protein [Bacteroidetes bacterium]|nr:domain containing protein [Bacteroidota bacterium]
MKRKHKLLIITIIVLIAAYFTYKQALQINPNPKYEVGQKLDSLNGVYVYYNGGVGHTGDRNLGPDGYNVGLKYQCVEFAKRYYYEHYKHKMPDSYGNAKDFFDDSIEDGKINAKRGLLQYKNPSKSKPQTGDLLVFGGHVRNQYGHVAIISNVTENSVEIIQQNPGPFAFPRATYALLLKNGKFNIGHDGILGRLRMP